MLAEGHRGWCRSVLPGKSAAAVACVPEVGEIALGGSPPVPGGLGQPLPFSEGRLAVVHVNSLDEFSLEAKSVFARHLEWPLRAPTSCFAEIDPEGRLLVLDPEPGNDLPETEWGSEGWLLDRTGIARQAHITVSPPAEAECDILVHVGELATRAWREAAERESGGEDLERQFAPSVRFDSGGDGDLLVYGAGAAVAVREGDGKGNAARNTGWGHAFRLGSGRGDAIRHGAGDGMAFRDDSGDGSALRTGAGNGDAVRDGEGRGSATRGGLGEGNARRGGSGDGGCSEI